jgi:acylphosphatase
MRLLKRNGMKIVREKVKKSDLEVCKRYRITGQVQGVGFRKSVRDKAIQFGMSGWVRNEEDGSVLAEFYGSTF